MENTLDPRRTALLLIDFEKGVLPPPESTMARLMSEGGTLANAGRIADACRNAGVPVVLVKVERRADYADIADYVTDLVLQGKAKSNKQVVRLVEGTDEVEFADELQPRPGDYVVVKRRVSAFYGTPLEIYLQTLGVDTLLFGGVWTNMGVESSVRDAYDRNYNIVVLSDCCAAYSQEAHEYPIKNIFPRIGRVMTTDEAIGLLEDSRSLVARS